MFNESQRHNPAVPVEKTVRELFDKCEKLRGEDGTANTTFRIGTLRRLADYLSKEFEVKHGFVSKRPTQEQHAKLVELAEQLRQCAFAVCEEHAVGEVSNVAITELREAEESLKDYEDE